MFDLNVEYYNSIAQKKGWSPVLLHKNNVVGYWWFGRWYNQTRADGAPYFYGAYPPGFLRRVEAVMHPIFKEGLVLHLFSGTLKGNGENIFTLDINPELQPDIIADSKEIPLESNSFDLILADPPYEKNYKKYGTKPIKKRKTFEECHRILKPGGWLLWLDTIVPQWRNAEFQYRGIVAVQQSTNHRTRSLLFLQKK